MTFEQDLYDLLTNHEKATVSDSFGGSKLGTNKAPNFSVSTMAKELLVIAHRGETGCERGFKHIARQARILADHDTMAVVTATKDTASPPCRRARRFPPSSRLRWLCHEYRLCRNICAP